MINKIDKVFYHKRTECLSVPWNITAKKIISDVIVLVSKNMRFNINEINDFGTIRICGLLTGITKQEKIVIKSDEFEDFSPGKDIEVSVFPIWEFAIFDIESKYADKMVKNFDFYVIGSINCIDSSIIDNLRNVFPWQSFMLYGDTFLDNPEYDNSTAKFLTNVSYELRDNFDFNKVSQIKKINIALARLRSDDVSVFNKISVSNIVDISKCSSIDLNDIMYYLEDKDRFICVPRRIYSSIINELWYNKGKPTDLTPQIGDTFYVKYPYVCEVGHDIVTIEPMNTIKIMEIGAEPLMVDNHECYECNIKVFDRDGSELYYLGKVIIDFSDYLLNFSNDNYEYDNTEEFEYVSNLLNDGKFINLGNEVMCIQPFRVIIPELTKYFTCKKIAAYIEFVERHYGVRSDSNWYKYVCNATEEIVIKYTDEFI